MPPSSTSEAPARSPPGRRPARRCSSRRSPACGPAARSASRTISSSVAGALGEDRAAEPLAQPADQPLGGRRAASGWRITTSISAREAQMVVSVPPASPPSSSNASAIGDSGTPYMRSTLRGSPPRQQRRHQRAGDGASATCAPAPTGGPGSTTMRWSPDRHDHAGRGAHGRRAPRRPRARWPACGCRAPKPAGSTPRARANSATIASICASVGSSSTSCRPPRCGHAGDRAVVVRRAEAAGGEHEVDAARSSADSAATISSSRSSTATIRSSRTPSPSSCARQVDEFVSTVRPIRISDPSPGRPRAPAVTRSA